MLLLNAAAALAIFAGTAVQAATWNVDVGASGNTFSPTTVTAAAADIVVFTLYVVSPYPLSPIPYPLSFPDHSLTLPFASCSKGGSHTVTQSSFADPCNPLAGGVDSGPSVPFLTILP